MNKRMSRKFLPIAVVVFAALVPSRALAVGRLTLGVKGGLNSANLRISSQGTISTYQTRSAFSWGGFVSYRLSHLFSVQVEVLDSPKGSNVVPAISGANADISLMYRYTEVPLLLKVAQGRGARLTPSLYAGPYWAKLKEARFKTVGSSGEITEDLADQKSHDFGLVFGFSLDYSLGPIALIGDVRYDLGLLDVDKTAGSTVNHRGFSFMVGIGF